MSLHCIVYMVLHGIVLYLTVLHCCIVVYMVLHGIVLYLTVLHGIALLASARRLYLARHLSTLFINRVLSGIENLDRVFFGYIPDKVFLLGSTKVLAAARPQCTSGQNI